MRSKVIGLGKCGSRLAYDLFAYVKGIPPSYNIRVRERGRDFWEWLERFRASMLEKWKTWIGMGGDLGDSLIADFPNFVTVDSDVANNEIFHWIEALHQNEESTMTNAPVMFPGQTHAFANATGGCDFHIVSEIACEQWEDDDLAAIVHADNAELIVFAFSIGGGTGGGGAPIMAGRCLTANFEDGCHRMGLGVLPESDQEIGDSVRGGNILGPRELQRGTFLYEPLRKSLRHSGERA